MKFHPFEPALRSSFVVSVCVAEEEMNAGHLVLFGILELLLPRFKAGYNSPSFPTFAALTYSLFTLRYV